MKVLLTGPSCAGKTSLARELAADATIHLDLQGALTVTGSDAPANPAQVELYEGIPFGTDVDVSTFLSRMDLVLLLDASPVRRFVRFVRRDGLTHLLLWARNEYWWHRVTKRLVLRNGNLRRVTWYPDAANAPGANLGGPECRDMWHSSVDRQTSRPLDDAVIAVLDERAFVQSGVASQSSRQL